MWKATKNNSVRSPKSALEYGVASLIDYGREYAVTAASAQFIPTFVSTL